MPHVGASLPPPPAPLPPPQPLCVSHFDTGCKPSWWGEPSYNNGECMTLVGKKRVREVMPNKVRPGVGGAGLSGGTANRTEPSAAATCTGGSRKQASSAMPGPAAPSTTLPPLPVPPAPLPCPLQCKYLCIKQQFAFEKWEVERSRVRVRPLLRTGRGRRRRQATRRERHAGPPGAAN